MRNPPIITLIVALFAFVAIAHASYSLIDCTQVFSSTYAGPLAGLTNYSGIVSICMAIIMLDFSILSVVYALGTAFNINNMVSFARTELLEAVFNVIILAAIGFATLSVFPAMQFFISIVEYFVPAVPSLSVSGPTGVFSGLCGYISTNIATSGFDNWLSLVVKLFSANIAQSINLIVMPNSWGYAYMPFGGIPPFIQVLWDDQAAFFATMFFGMFLIVMLFVISYLFPIFLYVGLALRSFPWTRAAGGSLIALFIAFYIIFPALMFPFLATVNPGPGICSTGSTDPLCNTGFSISGGNMLSFITNLLTTNLGSLYYSEMTEFVSQFFYIGLNILGLVIALLVAYEMVEKIGGLLGTTSLNAQRAFGRVL